MVPEASSKPRIDGRKRLRLWRNRNAIPGRTVHPDAVHKRTDGMATMRKMTRLSKLAAPSVTAAGLLLPLSPATAKERPVLVTAPSDLVVRHVSYADLDLAVPLGRAALHNRVGFAIEDVCAEANRFDNGSFAFKAGLKTCSNVAWGDARPQIARAVERANQLAATGTSSMAAAAMTITTDR